MGLAIVGVCIIILGVSLSGNAGMYLPVMIVMFVAAMPFFCGLYQAIKLLSYIEKGVAFSELSVKAIKTLKDCALTISVLYSAAMPVIVYVADKDDAPGVVAIGLVFVFAPVVVAVFSSVLEKVLQNAIDIKSDNDLTV
jgi:hypothetical protein